MGVILMDTEAVLQLENSYLQAGREIGQNALALRSPVSAAAALGTDVSSAVGDLGRLMGVLGNEAEDIRWRRLWLLATDQFRLGSRTLGWVPERTLEQLTEAQLLGEVADPDALSHARLAHLMGELAARSLLDPGFAATAVAGMGRGGLQALWLRSSTAGLDSSVAVLLGTASHSQAGLTPDALDFVLPGDSSWAAARIAWFGRLLGLARFSDDVLGAAATWSLDPANRHHVEVAMTKYRSNFAAAALGALAASGSAAALWLASPGASNSLSSINTPEAAFELRIDGDESTAALLDAVIAARTEGTLTAAQSFEVWLSIAEHASDSFLPGEQSLVALARLTNLHWDEIGALSPGWTRGLFAELASDERALATVSLGLGSRSVPLITEAAELIRLNQDASEPVETLARDYSHVFTGLAAQRHGSSGGLVISAVDTAIAAAVGRAGPAATWLTTAVTDELLDAVIESDHPHDVTTPHELFEHEFHPSDPAVPGGRYPAVSGFQIQVPNEVLRVEPRLATCLSRNQWFDGSAVTPPATPSDEFARWFARTTSGGTPLAAPYQALVSKFSDRVLLEALKVEAD
jgi:hypothetical protein